MTFLGEFSLWLAFLVGSWCAVLAFSGRWRDRPALARTVTRATHALFITLAAATLALWVGLATHDFNIEYVASYTSRNLPSYFVVSALWAGQKGSLLFWAVVLSLCHHYGVHSVLGFRCGYEGLGSRGLPPVELTPATVQDIHLQGGTMLGSSRGPEPASAMPYDGGVTVATHGSAPRSSSLSAGTQTSINPTDGARLARPVLTRSSIRRSRMVSGIAPSRRISWNSRRSNFAPSAFCAFCRAWSQAIWPIL